YRRSGSSIIFPKAGKCSVRTALDGGACSQNRVRSSGSRNPRPTEVDQTQLGCRAFSIALTAISVVARLLRPRRLPLLSLIARGNFLAARRIRSRRTDRQGMMNERMMQVVRICAAFGATLVVGCGADAESDDTAAGQANLSSAPPPDGQALASCLRWMNG